MSDEMKKIVACLQEAVDTELERKAKLGYNAVVLGKNGKPLVVPAKSLIHKKHTEKKTAIA